MILIEDTRQQADKHRLKHIQWADMGVQVERSKLPVGDYANIKDLSVIIDTKKDWQEVANNVVQQHERFRAECQKAQDYGIKLIILVEQDCPPEDWKNPRLIKWFKIHNAQKSGKMMWIKIPKVPPTDGKRLKKVLDTMHEKYSVEWQWCAPEMSANMILEILDRKE